MTGHQDAWGLRAALVALAGMAGATLQMQQAALWSAAGYAACLAVALAGVVLAGPVARLRTLILAIAVALALFAVTGLRAGLRLAEALPAALEGQDIGVTGVVAALPHQSPDGVRSTFEVESAAHDDHPVAVPRLISLGWYRGWSEDALIAAPFEDLRAGQRWRFTVRLKQDRGNPNIGGALLGAVIGGILGHQVGGGSGKNVATAVGVVGGAAISGNINRDSGGQQVVTQDVHRCTSAPDQAHPDYWDVTYNFRVQDHRMQMTTAPGATVTVNQQGEPRA